MLLVGGALFTMEKGMAGREGGLLKVDAHPMNGGAGFSIDLLLIR